MPRDRDIPYDMQRAAEQQLVHMELGRIVRDREFSEHVRAAIMFAAAATFASPRIHRLDLLHWSLK